VRILNMMGEQVTTAARAALPDVEVVEVGFGDPVPEDLTGDVLFAAWHGHPIFEQLDATGVRWMHISATGIDSWPRALLEGRVVTCARGVGAIPISEFVLASMLAFAKDFPATWLSAPPEHWNIADLGELAGTTVGIVGLGGIGTAVARRALAFDMRVRVLRRNPGRDALGDIELARDLPDLLDGADHVVLAAPGTAATHRMMDDAAFRLVKPGVHLVNIARGSLVDQDALRAALDDGRVARASLDTVDPEPLPAGHWLYSHPSVRLSAHVSWATPRYMDRVIAFFVANLHRFVAGEPLEGVVDVDEGY
jgi:phosphoglycerate dehydrogenase-like enzyme